jgi:hypothetical protein
VECTAAYLLSRRSKNVLSVVFDEVIAPMAREVAKKVHWEATLKQAAEALLGEQVVPIR